MFRARVCFPLTFQKSRVMMTTQGHAKIAATNLTSSDAPVRTVLVCNANWTLAWQMTSILYV